MFLICTNLAQENSFVFHNTESQGQTIGLTQYVAYVRKERIVTDTMAPNNTWSSASPKIKFGILDFSLYLSNDTASLLWSGYAYRAVSIRFSIGSGGSIDRLNHREEPNLAQNFFEEVQAVRFQHCDPAGIVFYPRYYEMLNLTVERFFERQLGFSFNKLHKQLNVTVPTVRIETDFLDASYLEDRLQFQMTLDRIGKSSLGFQIVCMCEDKLRLRALITLVCIDFDKKKATPWPDVLRIKIDTILAGDSGDHSMPRPDPKIIDDY